MNVHVKCLLDLSKENVCTHQHSHVHQVPAGTTARQLAKRLQMDPGEIHLIFINYKESTLDTVLQESDDVTFSPY